MNKSECILKSNYFVILTLSFSRVNAPQRFHDYVGWPVKLPFPTYAYIKKHWFIVPFLNYMGRWSLHCGNEICKISILLLNLFPGLTWTILWKEKHWMWLRSVGAKQMFFFLSFMIGIKWYHLLKTPIYLSTTKQRFLWSKCPTKLKSLECFSFLLWKQIQENKISLLKHKHINKAQLLENGDSF